MSAAPAEDSATQLRQYVSFVVGAEEYGVDIMEIREFRGWTPVTSLPNVPLHVRGVINLRGAVVPVFDLRMRFFGEPTTPTAHHVIMVVNLRQRIMGVLVDAVADILDILPATVQPIPNRKARRDGQFLSGLVNVGGKMVALLDLEPLLLLSDTFGRDAA
jgi:purine-binding chemotaxis protein CheW